MPLDSSVLSKEHGQLMAVIGGRFLPVQDIFFEVDTETNMVKGVGSGTSVGMKGSKMYHIGFYTSREPMLPGYLTTLRLYNRDIKLTFEYCKTEVEARSDCDVGYCVTAAAPEFSEVERQ